MMSSSDSTKEKKLARLAALKEKRTNDEAARAPSNGSSLGTTNSSISNNTAKVQITSPPRLINGIIQANVDVLEMIEESVEGKRVLIPPIEAGSDLALAPLTDEKGDYLYKLDAGYKKTSNREPLQLAEYRRITAKICLLYTSPSPRDRQKSRMPSSA